MPKKNSGYGTGDIYQSDCDDLLNLNHFWIKQVELCLKCTVVKISFMLVAIFFDICENPNPSYLKHPKIIN